ncbi:hypothetical protein JCM10213v2_002314 [Rhodosporidiobolus nylandii]
MPLRNLSELSARRPPAVSSTRKPYKLATVLSTSCISSAKVASPSGKNASNVSARTRRHGQAIMLSRRVTRRSWAMSLDFVNGTLTTPATTLANHEAALKGPVKKSQFHPQSRQDPPPEQEPLSSRHGGSRAATPRQYGQAHCHAGHSLVLHRQHKKKFAALTTSRAAQNIKPAALTHRRAALAHLHSNRNDPEAKRRFEKAENRVKRKEFKHREMQDHLSSIA